MATFCAKLSRGSVSNNDLCGFLTLGRKGLVENSTLIKHSAPRKEEPPRGERNTTNAENQIFLKDVSISKVTGKLVAKTFVTGR
jgi:hypothetical protein